LSWQPDGERYTARLETAWSGAPVAVQTSEGVFDAAGIAPVRYAEQRRRGGQRAANVQRAANFQRDAGKITFSGPSVEHPLWAGAQDRLSWLVQLAAVVAAEPQRAQPGGYVALAVVDARAAAGLWVFRFVGLESIETGQGHLTAAHFVREAEGLYDTQTEVWLAPSHHHLPVRVVFRGGPLREPVEWLLQASGAGP
jgi:Protein of unknown function (DUF3108)